MSSMRGVVLVDWPDDEERATAVWLTEHRSSGVTAVAENPIEALRLLADRMEEQDVRFAEKIPD